MILRKGSVDRQQFTGAAPPIGEGFNDAAGARLLGANIVTPTPGEKSALLRHWYSNNDECGVVLDGTATVIADEGAPEIGSGDVAIWPAAVENACHTENRLGVLHRDLCAGSNPDHETVHYPNDSRVLCA